MQIEALTCKQCGANLKHDNIDYQLFTAHCEFCGAVFCLKLDRGTSEGEGAFRARMDVDLPDGFRVSEEGPLRIERKWFSFKYVFMAVFAVIWNLFMVGWHVAALSAGEPMMSAFGIVHTGVGVYLIFSVLRGFVNRTIIEIRDGVLTVSHKPLPARGAMTVEAARISQVYCKEKVVRTKNGTRTTYGVYAKCTDCAERRILEGLDDATQAVYIENQIETHLGIVDREVDGEFK